MRLIARNKVNFIGQTVFSYKHFEDDGFVCLARNDSKEITEDLFSEFAYKIDPKAGEATRTSSHK